MCAIVAVDRKESANLALATANSIVLRFGSHLPSCDPQFLK